MDLISIGVGVFAILLGILIKHGKQYWLVAGYNTSSQKEKDKFNMDDYAVVMRNGLAIIGITLILSPIIGHIFDISPIFRLIELPIIAWAIIHMMRSSKKYYLR